MADPKLLPLFSESVTFFPPSATASIDAYGKRTFASVGSSFNARFQGEFQLIRDAEGRVVTQQGTIYLYETSPVITTDYRCVLSDGTVPIIISSDLVTDEDGDDHQVVKVGKNGGPN